MECCEDWFDSFRDFEKSESKSPAVNLLSITKVLKKGRTIAQEKSI
jgi:hypothetical protein